MKSFKEGKGSFVKKTASSTSGKRKEKDFKEHEQVQEKDKREDKHR